MLRAQELVLQFRHLLFRAVEHAAQFVADADIDVSPCDARSPLDLAPQTVAQLVRRHAHFLEERRSHAFRLVEEREEEMLIRDLLLIEAGSEVLRGLDGLLHLLGKFIDAHTSNLENAGDRAIRRLTGQKRPFFPICFISLFILLGQSGLVLRSNLPREPNAFSQPGRQTDFAHSPVLVLLIDLFPITITITSRRRELAKAGAPA